MQPVKETGVFFQPPGQRLENDLQGKAHIVSAPSNIDHIYLSILKVCHIHFFHILLHDLKVMIRGAKRDDPELLLPQHRVTLKESIDIPPGYADDAIGIRNRSLFQILVDGIGDPEFWRPLVLWLVQVEITTPRVLYIEDKRYAKFSFPPWAQCHDMKGRGRKIDQVKLSRSQKFIPLLLEIDIRSHGQTPQPEFSRPADIPGFYL